MPEETEIQEQEIVPEQNQELEEGVVPSERTIPYSRFEQVNAEKNRMAEQLHQANLLILQTQREALVARKAQAPDPEVDPDIDRLVGPIVEKRLKALQTQFDQQGQALHQMAAQTEGDRAWHYVEQQVPDIEALKPDILAYLDSLPPAVAHQYTSDPNNVVLVANMIRANKKAGISMNVKAAQGDLKARARSETGGQTRSSSPPVQWNTLSGDALIAKQRELGIKPINEW